MVRIAVALTVVVLATGQALAAGDVPAGELVFADKCASCHSISAEDATRGPVLINMIDRPAATVEGFSYSDAMKEAAQAGLVWDVDTLSAFLTKPRKVVNGSFMNFTGLSEPEDVANVIAYLATYSPPPTQ